jgi:hypothetical protein
LPVLQARSLGDFQDHAKNSQRAHEVADQTAGLAGTGLAVFGKQLLAGADQITQLREDALPRHHLWLHDGLVFALRGQRMHNLTSPFPNSVLMLLGVCQCVFSFLGEFDTLDNARTPSGWR